MLTSTEFYGNWRAKVPNNLSNQIIFDPFIVKATACFGGAVLVYPALPEKRILFGGSMAFLESRRHRKFNHVGLLCRDRRERHALCLSDAVPAAQVAVGFHCECTAVFVA
jgi:hypothetical protein